MKTLIIGASENPERYSNKALKKLRAHNIEVIAIGGRKGQVEDVLISTEINTIKDIDTITLYIGAKHQPKYYTLITELKPRRIIFNPGTENPELEQIATQHSINFIHACTLVMLSTNQY